MKDLDRIAITHLHTDHVVDLPALLKGGYFSDRTRPLPLLGPTGNRLFAAMDAFATGVLSHLMARSLAHPEANLAQIREHFDGRIVVAEDLMCLPLGRSVSRP